MGYQTLNDLIIDVGYGKITPLQIINRLVPKIKTENRSILGQFIDRARKKKGGEGVIVTGINDVLIKFGKCCQPIPGDPIVGYITQGQACGSITKIALIF